MEKQTRRGLLKNAAAAAVGATGAVAMIPEAQAQAPAIEWKKKAVKRAPSGDKVLAPTPGAAPDKPPLFNGIISFGNLVFLAGVGAHFQGTIEEHTKHVLDELEANLKLAGSSMEKVLKVNVYLSDLKDYAGMNSVYQGRWGSVPPVRTTIAVAGGVPGNSLVEIDCIASI
ncbi:RidA family protein [Granulicella sibirica]|nr:RidA family protein [Granulicella sibirica]